MITVLLTAFTVMHPPALPVEPEENPASMVRSSEVVTLRIAPDVPLTPPGTDWAVQTAGLGKATFVKGPKGESYLRFHLPAEGADAEVRISLLGNGRLLSDVKTLTYRVCHLTSPFRKGLAVRIIVDDDILIYEPQRQDLGIILGLWQEWRCSTGIWHSTREGPVTLAQYSAKHPAARLNGPIRIQAGFDGERWGDFEALLGEVEITTAQHVARYKFEL